MQPLRHLRDEPGVVSTLPVTNCQGAVYTVDITVGDSVRTVAIDPSVEGLFVVVENGDANNDGGDNGTRRLHSITFHVDNEEYVSCWPEFLTDHSTILTLCYLWL